MTALPLPGILQRVAELAGLAVALRLAAARGGTRAYIPRPESLDAQHWLVVACGADAAQLIAGELGGETHAIPLAGTGSRGRVWTALRRALAEGAGTAEAARLAGVDERTVRRHRNGYSGTPQSRDPRQTELL